MNRILITCSLFLIGCSAFEIDDIEIIDKILQPDYVASSKAKKSEIAHIQCQEKQLPTRIIRAAKTLKHKLLKLASNLVT